MSQPLSIEHEEWTYLITTRTSNSRLWFINDRKLEERILGGLARYQEIYEVKIYGFVLMGNHYHLVAQFPKKNRALFMRDFNSAVARLVGRYKEEHGRRSVWARRYSYQILPRSEDIFHWFYYIALNPVSSGIVQKASEYSGYNSFFDNASGTTRIFKWVNWSEFLMKRRYNPKFREEDFTKEYTLTLSKLPGYEELSENEYSAVLMEEFYSREHELVKQRLANGRGFLGAKKLKNQIPGKVPRTTKTSSRYSLRPIVLSLCQRTKNEILKCYFAIKDNFFEAAQLFHSHGVDLAKFPSGTYPPLRLLCQ